MSPSASQAHAPRTLNSVPPPNKCLIGLGEYWGPPQILRHLNIGCSGLNRNGPHRLVCLNSWPIGSGPVRRCGHVGVGMAFLEELCHLEWALGIYRPHFQFAFLALFLWVEIRFPRFLILLLAAHLSAMMGTHPSGPVSQIKVFIL